MTSSEQLIPNPAPPTLFNPRIRTDVFMDESGQERTRNILLSEAENWIEAGRSKIYDDVRKGRLSTEKDLHRGKRKFVDTAELESVYGKIRNPEENPQWTEEVCEHLGIHGYHPRHLTQGVLVAYLQSQLRALEYSASSQEETNSQNIHPISEHDTTLPFDKAA